ncbi:hypothetical protein MMC10_005275 [Thelotrema lepadinum]|nr:hypothetical protein [Thelotrema lepadinum]
MSPQKPRPDSKHRSRPSSGNASPTKSPRRSGDPRKKSTSPEKRKPADPEKRRSAAPEEEKRRSHASGDKRKSHASEDKRISYNSDRDGEREKRRSAPSTPRKASPRKGSPKKSRVVVGVGETTSSSTNALSLDSLAKLDALNEKSSQRERGKEKVVTGRVVKERHQKRRKEAAEASEKKVRTKYVSPASLEEAWGRRGGFLPEDERRRKRAYYICLGVFVAIMLIILIPVGVLVIAKENQGGAGGSGGGSSSSPNNSNLANLTEDDIPQWARGTYFDPFTWYDTEDFNVTTTNDTVGGLPVMGLNSTWDDSVAANDNVPPLNKKFNYGSTPIRGVNVGGWFSLEPFITPSLFNSYDQNLGIVDEYTLCQHLGPTSAAQTLEQHYSTFINEQSFIDIRNAGFDHVRIPFSYWAVTTYSGDPYVKSISWRYLLRAIEYARQNGLRVNLDLHAVPGSQNGWNHSGRQGSINWLNGTDGSLNGQRSLDIHNQLSQFFAQPRYKNVIALYGLVNEPKMVVLETTDVFNWTSSAIDIVRKNGITALISMADGFLGLTKWQGQMQGVQNLVLDAHQYVIFNVDQIAFDHTTKLNFACAGWTGQMQLSMNTATGFGPTLCGEWSQADTDCLAYLNNVNVGSRWEGTLNLPSDQSPDLSPSCPLKSSACSCNSANAPASSYSDDYKKWLLMNAEAQMTSFETGWGWFYWTWLTETGTQWSWKLGMDAGILPAKVWERSYNCSGGTLPEGSFGSLSEAY